MMLKDTESVLLEKGWHFHDRGAPYYDGYVHGHTRSKARYRIFKEHGVDYGLESHLEVDRKLLFRRCPEHDKVWFRGQEVLRRQMETVLAAEARAEAHQATAEVLSDTLEAGGGSDSLSCPLAAVKLSERLRERLAGRQVRIWSSEWSLWWKASGRGYTDCKDKAGLYDFEDAYARSHHCGEEKGIWYALVDNQYCSTNGDLIAS